MEIEKNTISKFNPIELKITIESELELLILKTLTKKNVTIPEIVADHHYKTIYGEPVFEQQEVFDKTQEFLEALSMCLEANKSNFMIKK